MSGLVDDEDPGIVPDPSDQFPARQVGSSDLFDFSPESLTFTPYRLHPVARARVTGEGFVFRYGLPTKWSSDRKPTFSQRLIGVRGSHIRDGFRKSGRSLFSFSSLEAGIWGCDNFSGNYYHWLCKDLLRLLSGADERADLQVLIPEWLLKYGYVRDTLSICPELRVTVVPRGQSLSVRTLYAVEPGRMQDVPDGERLLKVAVRAKDAYGSRPSAFDGDRIFISRRKVGIRTLANENETQSVLEDFGYQHVVMEDLTFPEQVSLMQKVRYLVSVHGAGLTNMMFMPEGSSVLELRRKRNPGCFRIIAGQLGHRYFAMPAEGVNPQSSANRGNLLANPDVLRVALREMHLDK